MTDSTNETKHVWTVLALKDHLEKLLDLFKEQFDRLLIEHVKSSEVALNARSVVIDKRLDDLNHESERLNLMKDTYVLQSSYDLQHENMRQDYNQRIDTVLTLIKSIQNEIKSLELTRAMLEGKASQASVLWLALVSIVTMIVSVIALVHGFTTK